MREVTKKIEYELSIEERNTINKCKNILDDLRLLLVAKSSQDETSTLNIDASEYGIEFWFTLETKDGLIKCMDLLQALEYGDIYIERK